MRVHDLASIRIKLASPEEIFGLSHGEVTKPEEGKKPAEGVKSTATKPKEEGKAEKAAAEPKKEEKR